MRHAGVLEAPVTRRDVGLFHALGALCVAASSVKLLRRATDQGQSDKGGEDRFAHDGGRLSLLQIVAEA